MILATRCTFADLKLNKVTFYFIVVIVGNNLLKNFEHSDVYVGFLRNYVLTY